MKRKSASTPASNEEIMSRANNSEAESKKVVLQRTLDDLTKRFGDGSIVLLGNNSKMQVDVISTGSLTLDIATGVGGLPRGRITEIYGPEASGKCYIESGIILSEYGMMTIGELWKHEGYDASCTDRTVEHQVGLINENGVIEKTSHLTWNNRKEVKYIKTSSGLEMGATYNHPIRVMSKNGNIVWKEVGEIQVGDTVVVMRDTQQFGNNDLSVDEATWIGYLVADGSLGDPHRIQFSNSDSDIVKDYHRISENLFPEKSVKVYAKNENSINHVITSTAICTQVFENYQLEYVNAADKEVPLVVRQASREAQIAFIRAYVELECHIEAEKRTIEVVSASKLLLQQVQLMLLNLGIVSRLSEKPVQGYEQMYYRLNWGGTGFFKYGEIIGFQSEARIKVYGSVDSVTPVNTNVDSIPNLGSLLRDLYDAVDTDRAINKLMGDYMGDNPKANLTYDRLALIIEAMGSRVSGMASSILNHLINLQEAHFFFDPVVEITDGIEPTFDVVMPQTHSFWSNGMISHNTSICLHVIAESQKQGGVCAFIDMEHALDPRYASRLGVNLDKLYIAQPDTGEQALEMTEALIRSGSVDVVVVDSVAALVPRAEIEGEMGDSHVGLQARLMSQALRKINGAIKISNCIVIFTNQLREKIGITFGSNETTSGGRALKFYASMRLDMRRIQTIKNGDEVIGGRSKIKVVKNKVAAPFREAEFDLMMNRGISKNGEIIDLGIAIGVVDKRGAFLRYNDILLGQGRSKAIEFLAANKSMALELENIVRDKFEKDNDILFSPPTLEEESESKMDIEVDPDGVILNPQTSDYVTPYDEKA